MFFCTIEIDMERCSSLPPSNQVPNLEKFQELSQTKNGLVSHFRLCLLCYQVTYISAGNTRVISQSALQTFQEEMGKVMKDPYKVCVPS